MKKAWMIVLVLMIVAAIALLWFLIKPLFEQNLQTIKYQGREYRLGSAQGLTKAQVKDQFNVEIVSSTNFYKGREIYISNIQTMIYPNIPTIIFLKQKNTDLFDVYSLQGGP